MTSPAQFKYHIILHIPLQAVLQEKSSEMRACSPQQLKLGEGEEQRRYWHLR